MDTLLGGTSNKAHKSSGLAGSHVVHLYFDTTPGLHRNAFDEHASDRNVACDTNKVLHRSAYDDDALLKTGARGLTRAARLIAGDV
jgi:hypothetical protein